jgi:hypothetical protein
MDLDLERFFDTVNHDRLIHLLRQRVEDKRIIRLIGMTILAGGVMIISAGAMSRAKAKLRELVPRGGRGPLEVQIDAVNTWYRGWVGYYAMGEYPSQLKVIEARARARFRLQFVKNHKRKKHLLRKLCDRGMRKGTAFREVYTKNHGRWRLAHTMSVNQAWSTYWFNDQGLLTYSQEQRPHWQDLKSYPSLL